jgi:uncharacterized protein (UPF0332 family)
VSLPDDLLAQARHLAKLEKKRPKQASLRRAVSAAYYALFHLLSDELVAQFAAKKESRLVRPFMRRALTHTEMMEACTHIKAIGEQQDDFLKQQAKPKPTPPKGAPAKAPKPMPRVKGPLATFTISSDLWALADAFANLQTERHAADYDMTRKFVRTDVEDLIQRADDAFQAWRRLRQTPEGVPFLGTLLLWKRLRGDAE